MKRTKVQAVALTLILLGSVFAGIGTQVERASATHDCNGADMLVAVFSAGTINNDKCGNNHVAHVVEDLQEADANQTQVDIYAAGATQRDQAKSIRDIRKNYVQDSESVAWLKAEAAMAEYYNNNKNNLSTSALKTGMKDAGKQAVRDYYTRIEKNMVTSWETLLWSHRYMRQRAEQEVGISKDYVGEAYGSSNDRSHDFMFYQNTTHSLINGTSIDVFTIGEQRTGSNTVVACFNPYGKNNCGTNQTEYTSPTEIRPWGVNNYSKGEIYGLTIRSPDSTEDPALRYVRISEWRSTHNNIVQANNELESQVDVFVNNTLPAMENGTINSDDLLSRTTKMYEYGFNNTGNSTFSNTIAALVSMGLPAPQLNGTGTMDVSYKGQTYTGLVFGNAPDNTWEVGVTYNSSNISGPVSIATTEGDSIFVNGTFTITNMTNKNDEQITVAKTKEYNYQTTNVSETQALLQDLANATQDIEDREIVISQQTSGGGSGNIIPAWLQETYFNVPLYGWAIVVMLLAYLANAVRGN